MLAVAAFSTATAAGALLSVDSSGCGYARGRYDDITFTLPLRFVNEYRFVLHGAFVQKSVPITTPLELAAGFITSENAVPSDL